MEIYVIIHKKAIPKNTYTKDPTFPIIPTGPQTPNKNPPNT